MTTQSAPLEVWMQFIKDERRKLDGRKTFAKLLLIQGVSHRELAAALGWSSHSYVGRLVRGQVTSVTPETAARIAHHLGVGIDDLFVVKVHTPAAHAAPKLGRTA